MSTAENKVVIHGNSGHHDYGAKDFRKLWENSISEANNEDPWSKPNEKEFDGAYADDDIDD